MSLTFRRVLRISRKAKRSKSKVQKEKDIPTKLYVEHNESPVLTTYSKVVGSKAVRTEAMDVSSQQQETQNSNELNEATINKYSLNSFEEHRWIDYQNNKLSSATSSDNKDFADMFLDVRPSLKDDLKCPQLVKPGLFYETKDELSIRQNKERSFLTLKSSNHNQEIQFNPAEKIGNDLPRVTSLFNQLKDGINLVTISQTNQSRCGLNQNRPISCGNDLIRIGQNCTGDNKNNARTNLTNNRISNNYRDQLEYQLITKKIEAMYYGNNFKEYFGDEFRSSGKGLGKSEHCFQTSLDKENFWKYFGPYTYNKVDPCLEKQRTNPKYRRTRAKTIWMGLGVIF